MLFNVKWSTVVATEIPLIALNLLLFTDEEMENEQRRRDKFSESLENITKEKPLEKRKLAIRKD